MILTTHDSSDRRVEPKDPPSAATGTTRHYSAPRVEKREKLAEVTGVPSSGPL